MDEGTPWITSLCNFYAKVWQMMAAKGTRKWLKPALAKAEITYPGAWVSFSSPHPTPNPNPTTTLSFPESSRRVIH
jgi:hypothetical protein